MSALRVGLSGRLPFCEANFFISGTFQLRKNGTFKFASYKRFTADFILDADFIAKMICSLLP